MTEAFSLPDPARVDVLSALRADLARARLARGPVLPFGFPEMDGRLADRGLSAAGLHEVAPRTPELSDDAAASSFLAGIAARFASKPGFTILWAVSRFDLFAPGVEQVGLGPDKILYAEGRKDSDVLALAEDGLRDGSLACVIAEVKSADQTATRRLQLAASEGTTPMLLYRRHRTRDRCPLAQPSSALTRWLVGAAASSPLPHAGIGRARWHVELVRQRNGNPFTLELEACDDQGRLALPAASADRTAAQAGAAINAA
jgi:protein ImuA